MSHDVRSSEESLPHRRGTFELSTRAWLPRPVDEVFPFFADAHNLNVLTPDWLHFRVLTPAPIVMREGLLLDYRIRLRGIPIRWRTRIRSWEPNRRFVDEQVRGPYLEWVHTHDFHEVDGGTDVCDTVRYRVLGGALVNALVVERDVRHIFEYRLDALRRYFRASPISRDSEATVRRLS